SGSGFSLSGAERRSCSDESDYDIDSGCQASAPVEPSPRSSRDRILQAGVHEPGPLDPAPGAQTLQRLVGEPAAPFTFGGRTYWTPADWPAAVLLLACGQTIEVTVQYNIRKCWSRDRVRSGTELQRRNFIFGRGGIVQKPPGTVCHACDFYRRF